MQNSKRNQEIKKNLKATKEEEEVTDTKDEPTEKSEAVTLLESANEEYFSNDKTLSPETLEKFSSLSSKDLVSAYLEMQKNAPQDTSQPEIDVTTSEINKIQNSVGGEQKYNNLVKWASENLAENEIQALIIQLVLEMQLLFSQELMLLNLDMKQLTDMKVED